jgi:drug/metabolite transporter (DMT)-like permease
VIAVILGWMILREPITPPILGGMALILLGVWGVFHEKYRPPRVVGPGLRSASR